MTTFPSTRTYKKRLKGVVVSDRMNKTVVVAVTRLKEHPKYKKRFKTTKKYKAHDAHNAYHTGEVVIIEEHRPMSKEKRWVVVQKVESSHIASPVSTPMIPL